MTEPATAATVPTALDFPKCRACQMWKDAGASWPRTVLWCERGPYVLGEQAEAAEAANV